MSPQPSPAEPATHVPDAPDTPARAHELAGLHGDNPLAFLAALGTLRTLARARPDAGVRLAWQFRGAWKPVLHLAHARTRAEIIDALHAELAQPSDALNLLNEDGEPRDNIKLAPAELRQLLRAEVGRFAATDRGDRTALDFLAAFACDAVPTRDEKSVEDTALRTMSGAGHQHFLKTMRDLVEASTPEKLEHALFEAWQYQDDKLSLRWDPQDDRRYALRWTEPSKEPARTVHGANRLAIEALPLMPTAPRGTRLATTGFSKLGTRQTYWTWPIWEAPVSPAVAASLLTLAGLQEEKPPRAELAARGIVEIYRARRLTVGKFRNFTPGAPPPSKDKPR